MKRMVAVFLALIFPAAVFGVAGKTHMKTDNQDCVECHEKQEAVWLGGKHGLMNVKCVVCHGSPDENFVFQPGPSRCRGCHGDKVADMEAKLPAKDRTCFLCHDNHTVAARETAVKERHGFHQEGGARK